MHTHLCLGYLGSLWVQHVDRQLATERYDLGIRYIRVQKKEEKKQTGRDGTKACESGWLDLANKNMVICLPMFPKAANMASTF